MSRRIVSLLPSATEMVCAVGGRDELVGISHECDHPPEVAGLPVLTRSRVAPVGSSLEVDRSVQNLVRESLAVFELDAERLASLRPDVILTQDLCDVCAVAYADVCEAVQTLTGPGVEVVNLHPRRLEDVFADLSRVGRALGRELGAERVVASLRARIEAVRRRSDPLARRPVVTVEWLSPVMLGGTWMPELVELAGGVNLGATAGDKAPVLNRDGLAQLAPEVVLIKPCGFDLARVLEELGGLKEALPWERWPACATGEVYVCDGNAYFNRPGPRLVESLEILAGCVHPEEFADLRGRHAAAVRRVDPLGVAQPF